MRQIKFSETLLKSILDTLKGYVEETIALHKLRRTVKLAVPKKVKIPKELKLK